MSHYTPLLTQGTRGPLSDIRERWFLAVTWVGVVLWFFFLLGGVTILASNKWSLNSNGRIKACRPDDSFSVYPADLFWSRWSGSGFFQITLGFDPLSFTAAKAIDVAWDIVIGRGGQGIIGLISWHIIKKYVTASMICRGPVTFHTYRTVFLQDQPLLFAIPKLLKDFVYRHRLNSKAAMACILSTLCFVLAFPTLASAMTGYTTNMKAYVPDRAGNLMSFEAFQSIHFVIHDGDRINQTKDYLVTSPGINGVDPLLKYDKTFYGDCESKLYLLNSKPIDLHGLSEEDLKCLMPNLVCRYAEAYGLGGKNQTRSNFESIVLPPPILNITAHWLPPTINLKDHDNVASNAMWTNLTDTYNFTYIDTSGTCQATKSYRWGFSFLLLYITFCLLLVWSLAMLTTWFYAKIVLTKHEFVHISGEVRAVFELAESMQDQLGSALSTGLSQRHTSETELSHRINKQLQGGSISYTSPLWRSSTDEEIEKISKAASLFPRIYNAWTGVFVVVFVTGLMLFELSLITRQRQLVFPTMLILGGAISLLLAVTMGSTNRSRSVLFISMLLLFIPLVLITQMTINR
ncbi:hypothetical protein DM02DRAFT_668505 [Periconia macrospinosa]|uniref:Uncharacterized protein n=1 Tax=Periconia macrospinosa TaxID=97972 RepID=A0A2V1E6I9_9PLEO|nr:hypothetical protein DM02DRAFT_668505 [Periconia macrospinosa]